MSRSPTSQLRVELRDAEANVADYVRYARFQPGDVYQGVTQTPDHIRLHKQRLGHWRREVDRLRKAIKAAEDR